MKLITIAAALMALSASAAYTRGSKWGDVDPDDNLGAVLDDLSVPNSNGFIRAESDPTVGLTNGTLFVHGSTITPLTSHQDLSGKQDRLVSGQNIKTVNRVPLLGSGNVEITAEDPLAVRGVFTNGVEAARDADGKVHITLGGGGGGIGASDATNIAAAVVVRDVPAWAREAEPPQTGVDAETATNIAEAVVERHEREGGAAWNRTGYWVLDYCVVPDTVDASRVYYSTNDSFQVFSNAEAAVVYGTSAVMRQTPLDRYAPEISPVEGYQCLTPGGTMDGARLLASSGGVYRVSATALDGSVRYSDVLLTADRRDEKVVSTYVADVTQERNLTASWAKTICDLAQKVRTYSVGGREVEEWSTALAPFCLKGSGNSSPFAVSAHVLASAAHYPQYLRYLGTQTFADGGTNVTVRKTAWINLKDWALTNGWSEADIAAMPGAADIAFVTLADETSLPNACTPSFLTAAARDELFGSMAGVAAWQGSQYQDYANPVVMLSNTAWTSGDYRGKMRADVATSRERLGGGLAWVRTGDSGKPVWIYPDVPQLPVVVAHTSTTAGGADWCAALPIIKAFVESRGDTLKIWR